MKMKIFFTTLVLSLGIVTYVAGGTCDQECGPRNPNAACVYYNGPGDHGKCDGWGAKPDDEY